MSRFTVLCTLCLVLFLGVSVASASSSTGSSSLPEQALTSTIHTSLGSPFFPPDPWATRSLGAATIQPSLGSPFFPPDPWVR